MVGLLVKYFLTAGVVMLVSELAKRSDRLGGLIAAMPLVTVIVLIWLYLSHQSAEKIANHAWYTFWYVIPTLPMFLIFPILFPKLGFWLSLGVSVIFTMMFFVLFALLPCISDKMFQCVFSDIVMFQNPGRQAHLDSCHKK